MEIGGAKIKGEFNSYIKILIMKFNLFVYFIKRGRNILLAQIFIYLVLQNNKKREIVILNNFFNFVVLQNLIEFNKVFLRFNCRILRNFKGMKKK
jgi:hypothetical protein